MIYQEELKEFIANRRREASPKDKDQHHPAGQQHTRGERPAQHAAKNTAKANMSMPDISNVTMAKLKALRM